MAVKSISRRVPLFSLALILAASLATTAQAAFPGVPGPIAYPRELISGEVLGGLVLHGPRRSQHPPHNRRSCSSGNCNLSPSWAPDGKHVAFLSVGRFSSDLEVMRSDGTQTREFADGSTEEEGLGTSVGAPAWGAR